MKILTKEEVEEISDYRETKVVTPLSVYLLGDYIKKFHPEWKYYAHCYNSMSNCVLLVKRTC